MESMLPSLSEETTDAFQRSTVTSFQSTETAFHDEGGNVSSGMVNGCVVVERQFDFLPWNNPDNFISLETLQMCFKVLSLVVTSVAGLGVVLNAVNVAVYVKLGLKDRINLLLCSLAGADLVACGLFVLYTCENTLALFRGTVPSTGPMLLVLSNSGALGLYGSNYVSGFVSTLIACERCLCISRPFKAKTILKTSTTGVIVLTAAVLLVALHYFVSEKYQIRCEYIPALKASLSVYTASDFYLNNSRFVDVLNIIVFGLFLPALFLLTTATATVTTAVQLRRAVVWRQSSSTAAAGCSGSNGAASSSSSSAAESREMALTRMLVAVSCLFVVCTVPNIVIRTTPIFVADLKIGGRKQNALMLGVCFIYAFGAINSALNFFFYYKMGSRFRETLRVMCGKRPGKASAHESRGATVLTSVTQHD